MGFEDGGGHSVLDLLDFLSHYDFLLFLFLFPFFFPFFFFFRDFLADLKADWRRIDCHSPALQLRNCHCNLGDGETDHG